MYNLPYRDRNIFAIIQCEKGVTSINKRFFRCNRILNLYIYQKCNIVGNTLTTYDEMDMLFLKHKYI